MVECGVEQMQSSFEGQCFCCKTMGFLKKAVWLIITEALNIQGTP